MRRALELGSLLLEARDGNYHVERGFTRFGDWVEQKLDLDDRQAYYFITIVERSRALGIPEEDLQKVRISKLKEIFALKSADGETIKKLVEDAETATLEEIKQAINAVKQGGEDDEFTFLNLDLKGKRIPRTVKESIARAFEQARREYGEAFNGDDISDWKVLELICEEWMQDMNRPKYEDVIEAEFEDIVEEA